MNKEYAFHFHYNKPAALAAGMPKATVHYRGTCHIVDDVVLHRVFVASKRREKQPRWVLAGRAHVSFVIEPNGLKTAHIGKI